MKYLKQFPVSRGAAGQDAAFAEEVDGGPVGPGHQAAGLPGDEGARSVVPGAEAALKEDAGLARGQIAEVQGRGAEAADVINRTRERGGRVIAVGTTSCRTLESVGLTDGRVEPAEGWTDIFIYPGYSFQVLDGLITNFHLPESTLIMLVSAFAGYEHTMAAYRHAVEERYRFFSFGDCCFIR